LNDYRQAAEALAEAFRHGARPDSQSFDVCVTGITASVRARFPRLPARDREEIAADAVSTLFEAMKAGRTIDDPGAWLLGVARNMASDRTQSLIRATPTEDVPDDAESEAGAAALLEALAQRDWVRSALKVAQDEGDTTVLRVVVSWLDIHERDGKPPSSRTVGDRAEVSHQGVLDALERFGRYLQRTAQGGP
jgi:DNA-directed RNA polymerase specialized sigma24 family protein